MTETRQDATPASRARRKPSNMHEGIAVWTDCCSCEAEPHWAALAEEMGIDLSDREPDDGSGPEEDARSETS
jgi:hypothetical protein